jgi:hypothetical protein
MDDPPNSVSNIAFKMTNLIERLQTFSIDREDDFLGLKIKQTSNDITYH